MILDFYNPWKLGNPTVHDHLGETIMNKKTKEQKALENKQADMAEMMGKVFSSFKKYGLSSELRSVLRNNPLFLRYAEDSLCAAIEDLEEFVLDIEACIFLPDEADDVIDRFLDKDWDEFADRLERSYRGGTMNGSTTILKDMGYSDCEIEEIIEWFHSNSAYCDSEVLLNIIYNGVVEMIRLKQGK